MKVYILRHGETDWNRKRLFQGQTDTSLNIEGFRQAQQCREQIVEKLGLTFDRVYSSPLCRAMETTETVSGLSGDRIVQDPRLMEMNFGAIDGTSFERDSTVVGKLFSDPPHYVPAEGAESFPQLLSRLSSFYDDLRKTGLQSVLVGSHGCAMRCMLVNFGYLKLEDIWNQKIGNCTIIETELEQDGAVRVVRFLEPGSGS